jgi:hypothetical protein
VYKPKCSLRQYVEAVSTAFLLQKQTIREITPLKDISVASAIKFSILMRIANAVLKTTEICALGSLSNYKMEWEMIFDSG